MTEQTLAARLARIMGDVGRVEKKGKISSQGSGPTYKFARDADVLEKVGPMMADAGIVMVPEHVALLTMDLTLSGKQYLANIKTDWHVTDGKESIRFETFGQGADSGDKALPKAQSNARKYAFFMLYHIVTGDDPDQHASEQPERVSGGHRAEGAAPSRQGGSASAPAPAPAQRTPEEQTLLDMILATGITHARMSQLADEVGVPKGQHANAEQLTAILARIESPSSEPAPVDGTAEVARASAVPTTPEQDGVSPATPAPAAPTDAEILAAAGPGAEIVPPKPGSPEYKALPSGAERASARAYWEAEQVPA